MTLPTDLVWAKAKVTRWPNGRNASPVRDRRVRVVFSTAKVQVFHANGLLAAEATGITGNVNGKVADLVSDTGEAWLIEKMDCGCGGG